MSGADILKSPSYVNERSRVVYFFDGYVAADIQSGTEEQQRAALALVGQAQRMAAILKAEASGHGWDIPCACETCSVLRAAGVMSDSSATPEGT